MGLLQSYSEGKLTKLNTLKYGEVSQTDAPLVTKSIPTTVNGSGPKTNAISARVDDLVRISKILTKGPGLKYLANETALNAIQNTPKFDPSRTFAGNLLNIAGNAVLGTAKVVGSTLAQVPVNGTGTHFVKSFAGIGKNTYLSGLTTAPHASAIKGSPVFLDYNAGSSGVNSNLSNFEGGPHLASRVGNSAYGLKTSGVSTALNGLAATGLGFLGGLNLGSLSSLIPSVSNIPLGLGPTPYLPELGSTIFNEIKSGETSVYLDYDAGSTGVNSKLANLESGPHLASKQGLSKFGFPAASNIGTTSIAGAGLGNVGGINLGAFSAANSLAAALVQPGPNSPYLSGLNTIPAEAVKQGQQFLYLDTRYDKVSDGSETIGGSYINPQLSLTGNTPDSVLYTGAQSITSYNNSIDLAATTKPVDSTYIPYIDIPGEAREQSKVGLPAFVSRTSILLDTAKPPIGTSLSELTSLLSIPALGQSADPSTLGNVSQPDGEEGVTTEVIDYRKLKNRNYKTNTYSLNYKVVNKEKKFKLGDPGKKKVITSFDQVNSDGIDQINAASPYTGESPDPELNDIIKFRFTVLDPSGIPGRNTHLHFRAFLDSLNDSYTGTWSSFNYVGRGEQFHTYSSFSRGISIGFKIAAQSKSEMMALYKKMGWLASTTAPTYSGAGYMRGTIVKMTVGDYLYDLPGFIQSVTYDIPQESNWEINISPNGGSSTQQQLPMYLNCTVNFTPIHKFTPETGDLAYFTNPAKGWLREGAKLENASIPTSTNSPVLTNTIPAAEVLSNSVKVPTVGTVEVGVGEFGQFGTDGSFATTSPVDIVNPGIVTGNNGITAPLLGTSGTTTLPNTFAPKTTNGLPPFSNPDPNESMEDSIARMRNVLRNSNGSSSTIYFTDGTSRPMTAEEARQFNEETRAVLNRFN